MPDHNRQKKIAIINDMSGFGRCSIAVELPIISHMKIQCCPIPTSIFSNHTGYDSFYFEDFTEQMVPYIEEWKKLNLKFEGICSGFLGSARQIEIEQNRCAMVCQGYGAVFLFFLKKAVDSSLKSIYC